MGNGNSTVEAGSPRDVLSPEARAAVASSLALLALAALQIVLMLNWIKLVANAALLVAACFAKELMLRGAYEPLVRLLQSLSR